MSKNILLVAGLLAIIASVFIYQNVQASQKEVGTWRFHRDVDKIVYGMEIRSGGKSLPINIKRVEKTYENIINEYSNKLELKTVDARSYLDDSLYKSDPNELIVILNIKEKRGEDFIPAVDKNIFITYLTIFKIDETKTYPENPQIPWVSGTDPEIFSFEHGNKEQFEEKLKESIRSQLDKKLLLLFCPSKKTQICEEYEQKQRALGFS